MAQIVNITSFAGTNGDSISVADAGWVKHPSYSAGDMVVRDGRAHQAVATTAGFYRSEVPSSANQTVTVAVYNPGTLSSVGVGPAVRMNPTAGDFLHAQYIINAVKLFRFIGGTPTQIGTTIAVDNPAVGTAKNLTLQVSGQSPNIAITVLWGGVPVITRSAENITALDGAGRVGFRCGTGTGTSATVGNHFASYVAEDDSAGADTTPPTLTGPTASATGATTASGSVSTNEANGTLYYLASANATELAATVKAGSSQAVTAINSQPVTVTGLTASTSYYLHFVHRDAAGNDSAVATSAQFTTDAANTSPSFTGPNIDNISGTEGVALTPVDVSAKFFDSESGLTFSTVGSWPAGVTVSSAGVISGTPTTAGTYTSLQVRATDAGSLTADSNAFTITVAAPGDAENPTLTGSVTFASITQTSYTANWPAGLDNVAVTGYEYQIGGTGGAWTNVGNNLSAAITGRTAGATETVYVRNYDAAGLRSTPAISGEVTLLAATASVTSDEFKNNTGTLLASATIPKVWLIPFGTPDYTNLVTNGAGELVISEAGLSGDYLILTANADGTEVGVSKATAS